MERLLGDFVFLFTVLDPIGTVPVFIAVTAGMAPDVRRRVALRAALLSAVLLLACIAVGQLILDLLDIDFAAVQVAGGIVLFVFGLDMIFGQSKPESEVAEARRHAGDDLDKAVFPLAVPSIAGPAAIMAVIVRTDNNRHSLYEQALTAGVVLVVLALVLIAMLLASRIQNLIGRAGASAVSRVMGLLFAALAADGVLTGVREFFDLAGAPGG